MALHIIRRNESGDQFESLLDAVEALLVVIEPLIGRCYVTVEQGQIAAQSCDVFFERSHAQGERVNLSLYSLKARAQSAQMLKNQVLDVLDHALKLQVKPYRSANDMGAGINQRDQRPGVDENSLPCHAASLLSTCCDSRQGQPDRQNNRPACVRTPP